MKNAENIIRCNSAIGNGLKRMSTVDQSHLLHTKQLSCEETEEFLDGCLETYTATRYTIHYWFCTFYPFLVLIFYLVQ